MAIHATQQLVKFARCQQKVEELHDGQQGLEHGANRLQRENDLYACIILSLQVGGNGATSVMRGMCRTDEQLPVAIEERKASGYKIYAPAAKCLCE